MRIIVTGGAGFIGSHITDALIEQQHDVLVLDDLTTGRRENVSEAAEFIQADIRDANTIEKIFDEFKPNAVSHQAAQTSVSVSTREPIRDAKINIDGEVPEGQFAAVDWPPKPLSPYACSKFAVENYLRCFQNEVGINYTILRYANVYGPRQDPYGEAGVVAIFINRLLSGQSIQINARKTRGDSGCIRDYVFVSDVVRSNLLALGGEVTVPILNVCTGTPTSTMQLATIIEREIGVKAEVGFADRRPGDVECSVLLANQAELLAPTVSLDRGIGETVHWFRESK
jgi:UDP-glucose 4-epimerase